MTYGGPARRPVKSPAASLLNRVEIASVRLAFPKSAAKQFRGQGPTRRPALAQSLFVQGDNRAAGCGERPLDAFGDVADHPVVQDKLAIGGKFHHYSAQHCI